MSTIETWNDYYKSTDLDNYSTSDLKNLLGDLQNAIQSYQTVEQTAWLKKANLDSTGFDAKRQDFLAKQKLINLQAERDNVMQRLIADYQNNTNMYGSSLKLKASEGYVKQLQDTVSNVNSSRLGSINADIMTNSRIASIGIEKYNSVSRVNRYFAVTILFLTVFLLVCIVAYLNFSFIPNSVLHVLLALSVLAYVGVILFKLYLDGSAYRMLQVEKDFAPPMEEKDDLPVKCDTCCSANSNKHDS